jgi:predicted nuclease of predicted toxin-antitoxin system
VKFLADIGVSQSTVRVLREHGHEVISLREQDLGRMSDATILDKARREECIVLTFDWILATS